METDEYEFHQEHLVDDGTITTLVHLPCTVTVVTLDHGDTLGAIFSLAARHKCPPVHRRDNVRCEAVQSALENLRDADNAHNGMTPTITDVWREAEGYIRDGLSSCTCKE